MKGVGGAIQIHHAVDNNVVLVKYSRNLINVVGGARIGRELVEYQSGDRNLTEAAFNQAVQRTVDFYREKLN